MEPQKAIARQETAKKDKYVPPCLKRRRHFTPLVFSVDGLRGVEATAACNRVASCLAKKWQRPYSELCGYVRSRISLALARTTSLCLCGPRDHSNRTPRPTGVTDGAPLGLFPRVAS